MSAVRRLICASLVLLAVGLLTPAVASASASSAWPMFGHDAQHSRRSPYLGAQVPTLKWAKNLVTDAAKGGWIQSSPALAADGTVYMTAQDFSLTHNQLYALDPSSGSIKWHTDASDSELSSPAVAADGTIYLGGVRLLPSGNQGIFFAFGSTGGTPKWTFTTSMGFYSSPTPDAAGNVYIGCDDGNVYSLSAQGDHQNWGSPTGGNFGLESSPALDGTGALYIGSSIEKMFSFAAGSSGAKRWGHATSWAVVVNSSPAVSDDLSTVYFADSEGTVYALATATGVEKWHHSGLGRVAASGLASSPAVGSDGTVYIGGADHRVYALNAADGSTRWTYETYSPVCSSPAIGKDGTVYVGSDDFNFYALDGSTGKLKWWYHTGAPIKSSPAIGADGTIYFGSEDGKLYAIGGSGAGLSTPSTSGALKHTVTVTYSGTIAPKRVARISLTFQRLKSGKWKAALKATVKTNAAGAWKYKKKLAAGKYRLQASTAASGAYKAMASGWKTFTIK